MKTTIAQQIAAVNTGRRMVLGEKTKIALNDAASNLAALNLIGQEKILIAPELIQEVKELLAAWHDGTPNSIVVNHFNKLENILNRLPK